ncbi:response regulator [Desulfobacula sp.]|uniref:response regulator n=1 Tax=Desulfobacula sp. TaxID=2593537 RepID=UPI00260FED1B|nr:response regulator [Desulfobacula sp.]
MKFAKRLLETSGLECAVQQSVRGFSPGENLVRFANENDIDHIFLGIKKKFRAQKAILESTVRYVILKAPCPVTTVNLNLQKMSAEALLKDRRILLVDDEPDILETVGELLNMCYLDTASNFDEAVKLIRDNRYDMVILDIMGVNGYKILERARQKDIPALMFTANALTPENLKKSIEKGADSYIPKDELVNILDHAAAAIKARVEGKQGYGAWFSNLKPFFDNSFSKGWRDKDRAFWSSFDDKYGG